MAITNDDLATYIAMHEQCLGPKISDERALVSVLRAIKLYEETFGPYDPLPFAWKMFHWPHGPKYEEWLRYNELQMHRDLATDADSLK